MFGHCCDHLELSCVCLHVCLDTPCSDLLRHPWTVGSGNPAYFDRLIEQMDARLVDDADVARKLDEIVRSTFAVLRRLLLCTPNLCALLPGFGAP